MKSVKCPRCGAPSTICSDSDFHSCQFCRSTFTISGDRGILRIILRHNRDEDSAWSALSEHLEREKVESGYEQADLHFWYRPFWTVTEKGNMNIISRAARDDADALPGMAPGDLVPATADDRLPEADIPLATAMEKSDATPSGSTFALVYLPFYRLLYDVSGNRHECLVEGGSWRVMPHTLPAPEGTVIPRQRLTMIACYVSMLTIAAYTVKSHAIRFALCTVFCLAAWWLVRRALRNDHS